MSLELIRLLDVKASESDVLGRQSSRRFGLWHDRGVFHFLTDERDRVGYPTAMAQALKSDGRVVVGAVAEGGPTHCSGLPVARYSSAELAAVLGPDFTVIANRKETHRTPGGASQPFRGIAAKMGQSPAG